MNRVNSGSGTFHVESLRIRTFSPVPTQRAAIDLKNKFIYYNIKKIEVVFILNTLTYDKFEATEEMKKLYGWEPVKVKHGESIWTRFYQCYILPTRFNGP